MSDSLQPSLAATCAPANDDKLIVDAKRLILAAARRDMGGGVLGARLGAELLGIGVRFPQFGFERLSAFIATHVPELVVTGQSGADDLYALRGFEDSRQRFSARQPAPIASVRAASAPATQSQASPASSVGFVRLRDVARNCIDVLPESTLSVLPVPLGSVLAQLQSAEASEAQIRDIALKVVSSLKDEDLRNLPLPLGLVVDVLNRD